MRINITSTLSTARRRFPGLADRRRRRSSWRCRSCARVASRAGSRQAGTGDRLAGLRRLRGQALGPWRCWRRARSATARSWRCRSRSRPCQVVRRGDVELEAGTLRHRQHVDPRRRRDLVPRLLDVIADLPPHPAHFLWLTWGPVAGASDRTWPTAWRTSLPGALRRVAGREGRRGVRRLVPLALCLAAMADLATSVSSPTREPRRSPGQFASGRRDGPPGPDRAAYRPEGGSTPGWGGVVSEAVEPLPRPRDGGAAGPRGRGAPARAGGADGDQVAPDGYAVHPDRSIGWPSRLMPGVTPSMWDWWFGWHGSRDSRYRLTPRPRERSGRTGSNGDAADADPRHRTEERFTSVAPRTSWSTSGRPGPRRDLLRAAGRPRVGQTAPRLRNASVPCSAPRRCQWTSAGSCDVPRGRGGSGWSRFRLGRSLAVCVAPVPGRRASTTLLRPFTRRTRLEARALLVPAPGMNPRRTTARTCTPTSATPDGCSAVRPGDWNSHCPGPKPGASANWATGARRSVSQVPVTARGPGCQDRVRVSSARPTKSDIRTTKPSIPRRTSLPSCPARNSGAVAGLLVGEVEFSPCRSLAACPVKVPAPALYCARKTLPSPSTTTVERITPSASLP